MTRGEVVNEGGYRYLKIRAEMLEIDDGLDYDGERYLVSNLMYGWDGTVTVTTRNGGELTIPADEEVYILA